MDWTEGLKFLAISVMSGVVTAIAVQFATGYLEQKAKLAARAEMEQIMIIAAQQNQNPQLPPSAPSPPTLIESQNYLIPDNSGIGYPSVIP